MHRTEGDGFAVVGGKNLFTEGDPLIPTPATQVTAEWANAVQEELALTIEGLGGTLNTAATDGTPNQLLTRLNAKYGRLDWANSWAGNQAVGGTLGVTGNTSLGGSLAVTASTTLTGPATLNGAATVNSTLSVTGLATLSGGVAATGQIISSGATVDAAGTAQPTKYIFGLNAVPSAAGTNNYPLSAIAKTIYGNLLGLNARARTTAATNGTNDWQKAELGMSYDVDNATGTGSQWWLGVGGMKVTAASAATGATPAPALSLTNGHLSLDGVTAPASNAAVKNMVTPVSIVKAHAHVLTGGATNVTVNSGFNITASVVGTVVRFTFPTGGAMASSNYTVVVTAREQAFHYYVSSVTAAYFEVTAYRYVYLSAGPDISPQAINLATNIASFSVVVLGAQ